MPALFDRALMRSRKLDKQFLENTRLPVITVSATFREDLKEMHGFHENEQIRDIVFSRAHYSMAVGIAVAAWGNKVDPDKAWIVDPTNYVSHDHWRSIVLTETIGKTLARHPFLKFLKDLVDRFGRGKLPILESITPPLLYLCQNIKKPILSLHIATGNILAAQGKKVIQVITDPHVRLDYLTNAHLPNIQFCVFDERTKSEFLEKARLHNIAADPKRVVVTGPPVDPRIVACRDNKIAWRSGPLRLCITTGGLGTNKPEIHSLLNQLLPELHTKNPRWQIMVYAGTQQDIKEMALDVALQQQIGVKLISSHDPDTFMAGKQPPEQLDPRSLTILYHPQIIDANELLLQYAFPWAHGFISKPSGDMAYDAAASGSFLLTLKEWGEWEHNIKEVFEQQGIAREAHIADIVKQLEFCMSAQGKSQSWIEQAMLRANSMDKLFLNGAKEIVKTTLAIS
ncbi:MAG: hypothetical protein GW946_02115 [Candidatus Pacebacteria bacterium]|nr:hypothetical protein [Candidatus Paceibacterota bacterium]PIR60225.1 MAG: hypothetical protein COU67_03130 [Candidatus Pacebacteria bacterium CG10_big_fil_rev_8_21_14_0_10_44_54]